MGFWAVAGPVFVGGPSENTLLPSRKGAEASANSKATVAHQPKPRLESWAGGKARF